MGNVADPGTGVHGNYGAFSSMDFGFGTEIYGYGDAVSIVETAGVHTKFYTKYRDKRNKTSYERTVRP